MSQSAEKIQQDLKVMMKELLEISGIKAGEIFVLGCSSSEVVGGVIGKSSNKEIGKVIVQTILELVKEKNIYLAVQGCEHINRALVVERELAEKKDFEIVSVVPALHAGGACSVAAFELFKDPVEIEHITAKAGIDIGDTAIAMHIKHVQIPLRLALKELGAAHVTALTSRPKLIGGKRAEYQAL